MRDLETRDAMRLLSAPDRGGLNRRRFLQAVAAVGGAAMADGALPESWRAAWGAPPIGPTDGVLVVVNLAGGNDGFDTVVPTGDSAYYANRGAMAIAPSAAHDIGGGFGLHPNLNYLKRRWDAGQLAIVHGVGYPNYDLSHFSSGAWWMQGQASAGPALTGWLGRWLDGYGASPDAFNALTIGTSIPLHLVGASRQATGLGLYPSSFGVSTSPTDIAVFHALQDYATHPSPAGPWGDAVAAIGKQMVDVNVASSPAYRGTLPQNDLRKQLTIAARLINLDLGLRIINVTEDSFDTHADQPAGHGQLMADLDDAINDFYTELAPRFGGRVTIMTFSEFGRQLPKNGSNGTDHGTASVMLLTGDRVRGGMYGTPPNLGSFVGWQQIAYTTDFRTIYAAVLDHWLAADSAAIIGAHFDAPALFAAAPGIAPGSDGGGGGGGSMVSLSPTRILDTRTGLGGAPRGLASGSTFELVVSGMNGIPPTNVDAVVMNVTVTEPSAPGYLTVFPSGQPVPGSSNLNFSPGVTVPNLVISKIGTGGRVSFFSGAGRSHVIADVVGYTAHASNAGFIGTAPFRALDTRTAGGPLGPGGVRVLGLAGVGEVPASGANAVVMNVTVTGTSAPSYLTVYPSGSAVPQASNLNWTPGQTVPNLVICKLGPDGSVCLFNYAGTTEVIVDVVGYFTPLGGGVCNSLTPVRMLDTRLAGGALGAAGRRTLTLAGAGGVPPTGASAVALNVTVTQPTAAGYVTVWPSGAAQPGTSNLNFATGQTVANLVMCKLGPTGAVDFFNCVGRTHVIADLVAWFS